MKILSEFYIADSLQPRTALSKLRAVRSEIFLKNFEGNAYSNLLRVFDICPIAKLYRDVSWFCG